MILLIPGNEFKIWKVKVDGRDGNVDEMISSNKLVIEATKGTYFNAWRNFLKNYGSVSKILVRISRTFVVNAMIFLIWRNKYRL